MNSPESLKKIHLTKSEAIWAAMDGALLMGIILSPPAYNLILFPLLALWGFNSGTNLAGIKLRADKMRQERGQSRLPLGDHFRRDIKLLLGRK